MCIALPVVIQIVTDTVVQIMVFLWFITTIAPILLIILYEQLVHIREYRQLYSGVVEADGEHNYDSLSNSGHC